MDYFNKLSVKSLNSDEINKIEAFRKSNQIAVLVILFSDIVNSTYATEELGERTYSKLRHIHNELFTKIMTRDNAGLIIKEIGDSFLCVFAEPTTAVLRSIEFQRAIRSNIEHLTVNNYTLTVKIGIHLGQVAIENNLAMDIFGSHVNRAARIESIANGGQILTSQAIWENAVGWIKDNKEENVGWISYGKTKLKGIEESIDIYGFYPKEIGNSSAPKIIRKQKQNRRLLLSIAFVALAALSFFVVNKIIQKNNKVAVVLPAARFSYYVQFDFSELAKQWNNNSHKSVLDTLALREKLLTQIIPVLYPDSIITESELIKSFSKKGKLYARCYNNNNEDSKYFRDSLKISGTIFVKFYSRELEKDDSLTPDIRFNIYTPENTPTYQEDYIVSSFENIENEFRNKIQEMLLDLRNFTELGYILNSNDSIVLFKVYKNARLREGTAITFMRRYFYMDGLHQRLEDIKKRLDYYKNKPEHLAGLNGLKDEYTKIEKDSCFYSNHTWGHGIELEGKVIELYDSIGKATWITKPGQYPFDKPKQGDVIYFAK